MWLSFSIAFFLYIAILYVPAYYFLSALQIDQRISLAVSPVCATFLYALSGIVLYRLGIKSTPQTVILPWAIVLLVAGIAYRLKDQQKLLHGLIIRDFYIPGCYVVIGVLVTTTIFVAILDGATAFFQDGTDNYFHLNTVRSFAQSGDMSCLSVSYFEHSSIATFGPGFYPAEWHMLVALCMQAIKVEPTICINALNTALISVVFPLSLYSFLVAIDPSNTNLHLSGSVTALAVCSCPWEFLLWGPLYPNLLGLVFIFSVSSCFIVTLNGKCNKPIIPIVYFILGCCAITLAQPNCIMTMGVLLAPYLVLKSYHYFKKKGLSAEPLSCAVLIAIVLFWVVCRNSPAFLNVATFNWPPIMDAKSAVKNIILLRLFYNPAQWFVISCLIIGLVRVFYLHRNRWLCLPAVFFAVAYIIDISSNGLLRTYFSGFWYNDFYRIACMYGLCIIPIITYGLETLVVGAELAYARTHKKAITTSSIVFVRAIPIVIFYIISFRQGALIQLPNGGNSCFGFLSSTFEYQYTLKSPTASLNEVGAEFLNKVKAITGTSDLVINDPNDGSVYAYGLKNINTYYRKFFVPNNNKTSDLIRTQLANISSDKRVQKAVKSINAKYVLVLDDSFDGQGGIKYFSFYKRKEWEGIHKITESTPGFEPVLIDGNMRLYRITALD